MGRKKMKTVKLDLGGKKLIEYHTQKLNKHGELKGRNKRETKLIKDTCLHHKIGKKGKVKSRIDLNGSKAHCTMCDHDFIVTPYDRETRKEVIDNMWEFTDQTKFMAAAVGADENTLRTLGEFSVGLDNINRINKVLTKIVKKEDMLSKKKKKNKNSSQELGDWSVKR